MDSSILIPFIVSLILMAPALVLIFIPMFPTIPYVYVIALVFAAVTGFDVISGRELIFLAIPVIVAGLVDYLAGVMGAKYGGASGKSLVAALIGVIVGALVLPPFGGVIGLFVAVLIAEIVQFCDRKRALKVATASFAGTILGMFVNFFVLLTFIALYLIFIF